MKIKEIILLLIFIVCGVFFYHVQTGKLDIDWGEGFFFNYDEFKYTEYEEVTPPFPKTLDITNAHGEVIIEGGPDEKISINLEKRIFRRNEEDAREVSDKLKMQVQQENKRLRISTNRSDFGRKRFRLYFRLTVPEGMDVYVKNSYGKVSAYKVGKAEIDNPHGTVYITEASGNIQITNRYKDVEVLDALADCQIETRNADVIATKVKGHVYIENRYGKVNLEDITESAQVFGSNLKVYGKNIGGSVEIESSYKKISLFEVGPTTIVGNHSQIEAAGIQGLLKILNKYSRIEVNDLNGDLFIDGKNLDITANRVFGEKITITTSYEDINLLNFTGKTIVNLSHGKLTLTPLPLTDSIRVEGNYADIDLFWPKGEKYPFEATVKTGDIHWELAEELSFETDNGYKIIKAFTDVEDKPSIYLSSTYRTIRIE